MDLKQKFRCGGWTSKEESLAISMASDGCPNGQGLSAKFQRRLRARDESVQVPDRSALRVQEGSVLPLSPRWRKNPRSRMTCLKQQTSRRCDLPGSSFRGTARGARLEHNALPHIAVHTQAQLKSPIGSILQKQCSVVRGFELDSSGACGSLTLPRCGRFVNSALLLSFRAHSFLQDFARGRHVLNMRSWQRAGGRNLFNRKKSGGAGEVRTRDNRFRKPMLYPSELQPRTPTLYYVLRRSLQNP